MVKLKSVKSAYDFKMMISKKKEKKKILPSLVQFLTDKIGNSCMTRIIYERGVLFFSRKNRSSYLWSSIKGKKKGKKARNHGRSRNSDRNITHRLKFARFTPDIRAIKEGGPSPPPLFSRFVCKTGRPASFFTIMRRNQFRNRSRNISCSFAASNGTSQIGWKVKVHETISAIFTMSTFSMQLKILDYSCFRPFQQSTR